MQSSNCTHYTECVRVRTDYLASCRDTDLTRQSLVWKLLNQALSFPWRGRSSPNIWKPPSLKLWDIYQDGDPRHCLDTAGWNFCQRKWKWLYKIAIRPSEPSQSAFSWLIAENSSANHFRGWRRENASEQPPQLKIEQSRDYKLF
jgi:hypothetical protein